MQGATMGTDEDIARLRGDISELYDQCREHGSRLTRLEERSDNRDKALEDLRASIKDLEAKVEAAIAALGDKIQALINAPAQKVAGRWDMIAGNALLLITGAVVAWLIGRIGL
jgi:chromosome segregation ATPase